MKDFISIFTGEPLDDFRDIFSASPHSFADKYPKVPKPDSRLSPKRIAARWASHALYGEDMPSVAAEMLEAGYDSPSLRRLAGEINVQCLADVEDLVARMFRELSVAYPLSETELKRNETRQTAREVIAGERNAWAAANHLTHLWGRNAGDRDATEIIGLIDDLDWDAVAHNRLPALTTELLDVFARIGALTDKEKRLAGFGLLEGQGWIADDFNAPLPEEIQAAFEGREPKKI